jgi:hypothetical protein
MKAGRNFCDVCDDMLWNVVKLENQMFQIQACGQPPKDLVGDLGSVVTFDEDGFPLFSFRRDWFLSVLSYVM